MDKLISVFNNLISSIGTAGVVICTLLIILFFIQAYYYIFVYGRIPQFRNNPKGTANNYNHIAVSVVVVVHEDYFYIEEVLPKLLAQDYHTFEVVVVDLGVNDEFSHTLQEMAKSRQNLHTTKVKQTERRFDISNKMALNIGIKAASYHNIIITTSDSFPSSDKWLAYMAKGFATGEVVLGYCGMERENGPVNRMMRASKLMMGVRYLSSAIKGKIYRGDIHNIGFTKDRYFAANGFNHLNLNLGEDDLFIQKIATPQNTSLVMNSHATMRQRSYGGYNWWTSYRNFFGYSYKMYPVRFRLSAITELWTRLLFFALATAGIVLFPLHYKLAMVCLLLARGAIIWFEMWRIRKRLGEGGIGWAVMLYDITSVVSEFRLWFSRNVKPSTGVWR